MIRTSRLFYTNVVLIFLLQMQTHVNVKKLVPPSFYDVAVVTEGVPSVQEESVV